MTKLLPLLLLSLMIGCGGTAAKKNKDFFTSGNREADQRADQRMVKSEQLKGEGSTTASSTNNSQPNAKPSLYQRLGADAGLTSIVDDWITRSLADPRVNFTRKGVTQGGFSFHRNRSEYWNPTPANVAQLKKHFVQFISLATGGPAHYDGKEIKQAHSDMHISNAEFDASIGDLKATLDSLHIPNQEQKELLSIIESTRPQIAEER